MGKKKTAKAKNITYENNDVLENKNDQSDILIIIQKDLTIHSSKGIVCCLRINTNKKTNYASVGYLSNYWITENYKILEKGSNNNATCDMLYCDHCNFLMPFTNNKCMMEALYGKEQHSNCYITSEQITEDGTSDIKKVTPEETNEFYKRDYDGYTNVLRIPASEYFKEQKITESVSEVQQYSLFDKLEDEDDGFPLPEMEQNIVKEPIPFRVTKTKNTPTRYKQRTEEIQKEKILRKMLERAKKRAQEKGWEFNLTIHDIEIPNICPIMKKEFYLGGDSVGADPLSPSLDRIDSTKGYIKGNVCVISHRANTLKNNLGIEELIAMGEYVKQSIA